VAANHDDWLAAGALVIAGVFAASWRFLLVYMRRVSHRGIHPERSGHNDGS